MEWAAEIGGAGGEVDGAGGEGSDALGRWRSSVITRFSATRACWTARGVAVVHFPGAAGGREHAGHGQKEQGDQRETDQDFGESEGSMLRNTETLTRPSPLRA